MITQVKNIEKEVKELDITSENFQLITSDDNYYEENKNIIKTIKTINTMISRLNNQKNEELNFIHSASHEMKTPLTVMKGYTGWAINGRDKKVIREYVDIISDTI